MNKNFISRVFELGFLLGWGVLLWLPWSSWEGSASEASVQERQLGASAIYAQLNGVITGSSIIIAGIGAITALSTGKTHFESISGPVKASAFWSALSLAICLYIMGIIPSNLPNDNPVKVFKISFLSGLALAPLFLGAFWFVRAVFRSTQ